MKDPAERCLQDCSAICRRAGFKNELGIALALRDSQLCQAIQVGREQGSVEPILYTLPTFVWRLAQQGESELAIEVRALALREYPKAYSTRWLALVTDARTQYSPPPIGFTLPRQVVAQAQARGRAGDLWATVEELYARWCE
jgi:hypothetical protein